MDALTFGSFSLQWLRPAWLLLLPVIWALTWIGVRRYDSGGWARYIARDKLPYLVDKGGNGRQWWALLCTIALSLGTLALAGPSWEQHPLTALKNRQSMVIVFDLSPSMLSWDVKPNRVTQARLKLRDLLKTRTDGETALIAYAANAYRVMPLTDDPRTIDNLIPTLHPDIMPAPGSQTEEAISLAVGLFTGAGLTQGDIVLITDGVAPLATQAIAKNLPPAYRLSILAVGTDQGSPIPTDGGSFLRDRTGQLVTAGVDHSQLSAMADYHHGRYARLVADSSDIEWLSGIAERPFLASRTILASGADTHVDAGWWLVLLILPIAALAFRKNVIWCATLAVLAPMPQGAHAADLSWLWQNSDQRAWQSLQNNQPATAARQFRSKQWAGVAHFRAANFGAAAENFAQGTKAGDHYNHATALALAGKLQQAVTVYERALAIDPLHADARHNRDIVKQAIKQIRDQQSESNEQKKRQATSEQEKQKAETQGTEAAQANQASQSAQIGGTSSEGHSQGQQSLEDQGGESTRSQAGQADSDGIEEQADKQKAGKSADVKQTVQNFDQGGRNDVLNPYSEQWLRDLKDDPGALMRRKFRQQSKLRGLPKGSAVSAAARASKTNTATRY